MPSTNQNQGQAERPFVYTKPAPKSESYAVPNGKFLSTYFGPTTGNPSGWVDRPFIETALPEKANGKSGKSSK